MRTEAAEFRGVVERHQRMVFSLALRVTGEYGTAEEVAQDVFLELFRSAERLSSEDHMRFWLRKVTVHRATDALRRQAHRPETQADEWMDDAAAPEGDGAAGVGTVLEARLEELLGSLPEQMRVAVVLRYQEEMVPDEIAKLLGQPVATVKSNLQRGLKLLRRKAEITMKEYVRPLRGGGDALRAWSGDEGECAMSGPDFEKDNAEMTEFEQALTRAMKRVEVRAETTAKFLALAEEAERKRVHAGGGLRLMKLSNGGRVIAMPRMPQPRAWMGGAIAAVLAMGCFVGARIHIEHERRIQAERQFETAERITDQTLERTREQLAQRGIQLAP